MDPYHIDTDPGSEKISDGSGSRPNFDKDPVTGKSEKFDLKNAHIPCFECLYYLTITLKNTGYHLN